MMFCHTTNATYYLIHAQSHVKTASPIEHISSLTSVSYVTALLTHCQPRKGKGQGIFLWFTAAGKGAQGIFPQIRIRFLSRDFLKARLWRFLLQFLREKLLAAIVRITVTYRLPKKVKMQLWNKMIVLCYVYRMTMFFHEITFRWWRMKKLRGLHTPHSLWWN